MILATVEVNFAFGRLVIHQGFRIRFHIAARNPYRTIRAIEGYAFALMIRHNHPDAILVYGFEIEVRCGVPDFLLGPLGTSVANSHRAGQLCTHAPLTDIRMMSATIGDGAAGISILPAID